MAKDPYNPTVKAFKKNGLLEEILYPDGRPEDQYSNNRWEEMRERVGESLCVWYFLFLLLYLINLLFSLILLGVIKAIGRTRRIENREKIGMTATGTHKEERVGGAWDLLLRRNLLLVEQQVVALSIQMTGDLRPLQSRPQRSHPVLLLLLLSLILLISLLGGIRCNLPQPARTWDRIIKRRPMCRRIAETLRCRRLMRGVQKILTG